MGEWLGDIGILRPSAAAWLGRKVKLEALANHVAKVSRRMYEAPEFFYCAIADGR